MAGIARSSVSASIAALGALLVLPSACGAPSQGPGPVAPGSPGSADASAVVAPPLPPSDSPAATAATPLPPGSQPWPFGPPEAAQEKDARLERIKKDPGLIMKSNWTPPGKSERYGHAEAIVGAPVDVVRARLADFPHYRELAGPKFKKVNVVDKAAGKTDVYFQLPIMKGLVTLWYITRFSPPRAVPGGEGEVVEGTFVKGNIKSMHIALSVRPGLDEKSSVVLCDLLLSPNVPAPQSAIDEELRDACGDAIKAVRVRTEAPPPLP